VNCKMVGVGISFYSSKVSGLRNPDIISEKLLNPKNMFVIFSGCMSMT